MNIQCNAGNLRNETIDCGYIQWFHTASKSNRSSGPFGPFNPRPSVSDKIWNKQKKKKKKVHERIVMGRRLYDFCGDQTHTPPIVEASVLFYIAFAANKPVKATLAWLNSWVRP